MAVATLVAVLTVAVAGRGAGLVAAGRAVLGVVVLMLVLVLVVADVVALAAVATVVGFVVGLAAATLGRAVVVVALGLLADWVAAAGRVAGRTGGLAAET